MVAVLEDLTGVQHLDELTLMGLKDVIKLKRYIDTSTSRGHLI